jgi:hypothetical protein
MTLNLVLSAFSYNKISAGVHALGKLPRRDYLLWHAARSKVD